MKWIDTHAHYDLSSFDADRDELFAKLNDMGIEKIICPAVKYDGIRSMMDTLEKYPDIYFALGQHPKYLLSKEQRNFSLCATPKHKDLEKYLENAHDVLNIIKQQISEVSSLLDTDRVCAIGEVGLDYSYALGTGEAALQSAVFRSYIELSLKHHSMPLVLHVRDAHKDTLRILKSYNTHFTGVIHCFRADKAKEFADQYIELGFCLGIGTSIFNYPQLRQVIKNIDLASIVLETDSPYLPIEGKTDNRNTSLSLPLIAEAIAKEKGISTATVAEATYYNSCELFHL